MWQCKRVTLVGCLILLELFLTTPSFGQSPPLDLWTPEVMARIRDQSTLNHQIITHAGYFELFYDSEIGEAKWADSGEPYEVHTGDTIRIHGFLASPLVGGPYPGIVIGHGHHGQASRELAIALAALGYVALSISGPQAGRSTGGPSDTEQAWISVEEVINEPAPEVGYLYHYAYAGMRGLTLLQRLARLPLNPFRIDPNRLGVLGASMGGQFTYYINGVDDRVKGAVAIAVAGDWQKLIFYPGAWFYHGLFYYTRDGLKSRQDQLNTISDVCEDPTMFTFLSYFDPISYAPTQHGPLLTILGTHDQYFTIPAINTTYDQVTSAGTDPRFIKRVMLSANGKHGVLDEADLLRSVTAVIQDVDSWFKYSFRGGPTPLETPTVRSQVVGEAIEFRVSVTPGSREIRSVDLNFATQLDTTVPTPCDFATLTLSPQGNEYVGSVAMSASPPCGPAVTPENILYYATVKDAANYTITSKMYYKASEMDFCSDFVPLIEHFPRDTFPVQPPPAPNCTCPRGASPALP